MSKLGQLKSELESVASEAQRTAGDIRAFESKFTQAISEVHSLIGGTATKTDQQIMEVLTDAGKAVKSAADALEAAAKAARDYANSV